MRLVSVCLVASRIRRLLLALGAAAVCALPVSVHGQTVDAGAPRSFAPTIDDWGEHGLMQVPSARTGADGDFSFTFSHVHPYDRYNLFMTPLPWLDAGFRYTDINNRPYGPALFSGNQTYKDRSFDAKIRLTKESADFPELAVGFRDIAGTGLFSSEYLVASRRYYNFDVTFGLGWGMMSNGLSVSNPFGALAKSWKQRPTPAASGSFGFDYFHGPKMGLFGGVEYRTPIDGLRLKLELDPDDYKDEPLGNSFKAAAPVNFGVVYDPYPFLELGVGLERGNTIMLRISLLANFNSLGLYHDSSKPPKLVPRPNPEPPPGIPFDLSAIPRVASYASPAARAVSILLPPRGRRRSSPASAAHGVDRLFSGAHQLGFAITDVSLKGNVAALTVSPSPGASPGAEAALERLAVADLPGIVRAEVVTAAAPPAATAVPGRRPDTTSGPPDEVAVAHRIFAGLKAIGFTGEEFALKGRHAYLTFSQAKYRLVPIAIGRAARIVAADSPPEVEVITLDLVEDGMTMASVSLQRRDLERAVVGDGSPEEVWAHTTLAGADPNRPPGVVNEDAYPKYSWNLNPAMRQEIGGPDNFLIYQIYAALSGTVKPAPGWNVDGVLGANLFNNLNALRQTSNSVLPHVRSDLNEYLKNGKTGVFRLEGDYFANLAPNFYGRVSAGLLEEMFAGVDGEVLYRPYHERWAVGLDLNHVVQRGFHDLFGFRPYQVTTGHLSFYYKLPFYNLQAAVHVGRYLAGDKGATFELSREFAGGIRAGIFFTRTNVSAQQFGEGSFDKGFMISVPIDLLLGEPSQTYATYVYRPLTRDGGQMLDIAHPLYDETDGYDPGRLSRMWPHLLD